MRSIGLDVHRDFCEVAIADEAVIRSAGRVETTPDSLRLFAESLAPDDQVALEATGNALAIAAILRPHVGRVALANPAATRGELNAPKTDKIDARALARLLATGFLPEVWAPDPETAALRHRLARRRQLVKQRTREKNQVHAVLQRNLKGKAPASDLFGAKGRGWLADQELPEHEHETVKACLRHIDFLDQEVAVMDRWVAERVLSSPEMLRLMQLPGVSATTSATLMAAVGDITRFPTPRHLVSYLGLNPKVRQSGSEPAKHGRISKRGPAAVRGVLTEAAWVAVRTPGPLRAFWERTAQRRGGQIATIAVARKLVVIAWNMLTKDEDYAFTRPAALREKLRRLELMTGAQSQQGKRRGARIRVSPQRREAERELARQAEVAYRRLVADWQPSKNKGAGATPGRASIRPSSRQAARQASKPQEPAL
jgi:transposase